MSRQKKNFKRKSGFRDAKLVVVATEGEKTEPAYFNQLKVAYPNPRIHLEIIPSKDGASSPKHILQSLVEFKKEYRVREDDELWIVIDRDFKSWTMKELKECMQLCKQKKFLMAISNPSFEIWLLLHFECIASKNEVEKEQLKQNSKIGKRSFCEMELRKYIKTYNKKEPKLTKLISKTEDAMLNAHSLHLINKNFISNIGTNVHYLVEIFMKL